MGWVLIGSDEFWWGVFFEGLPTKTHQPLLQPVILSKAKDLWDSTAATPTERFFTAFRMTKEAHKNSKELTRTQKRD